MGRPPPEDVLAVQGKGNAQLVIFVVGERHGSESGQTSTRLAALCGVDQALFMDSVLWLNLWDVPGTRAERYVRLVEEGARHNDAIILLGKDVQHAFGLDLEPLGEVIRAAGLGPTVVAVPHTSGRNLWWNDPDHRAEGERLLRRIWGSHAR